MVGGVRAEPLPPGHGVDAALKLNVGVTKRELAEDAIGFEAAFGGESPKPIFLTLNPQRMPREELVHPNTIIPCMMRLWSLQGVRNTWSCGAHFGAGFHEDGPRSRARARR